MTRSQTERVRDIWEADAGHYDAGMGLMERLLFGGGREWVCAQAAGDLLEIAVGTGRNLPFYPPRVRLTAIDVSPSMLAIARRRATELGLDADLRDGDAQQLDFEDGRFDTVVCTLALCSIPNDRRAVAEAARVPRPGGRLLHLEQVRTTALPVRALQRILARTSTPGASPTP